MMEAIQQALVRHWGYDRFLPLQERAMGCLCRGRDSVVVLPTGGGKSLCYQAPAVTMPGVAIVVSPLIALMKDQVDGLRECGVAAARVDSTQSISEQNAVMADLAGGSLKLLYVSPERLVTKAFLDRLGSIELSFIAIDEAHCVSMWGHDFRPEYRQLGILKKAFPGVTIAAYTATATQPVREDIACQLGLDEPEMIVGLFDRPNLVYKVTPRHNVLGQVREVMDRHKKESGIIYCIRRKDVDSLCEQLKGQGYSAAPYHAGMEDEDRKTNQELFINEQVDVIVATIAFGMGIDKSNVRYVIHTGMPKSLEHYQQESGRAGRDGLEAECVLFYSGGDYGIWKMLTSDMEPEPRQVAHSKLNDMYRFCTGSTCRHKAILQYFGQSMQSASCQACDLCLGEFDALDDALIVAQKILSCIVRLDQRFGADYTAMVLTGSTDQRIMENRHNELSTYGLLRDVPKRNVHDWIEQLVGQAYIEKTGDYNVLCVTAKGWNVLRGNETPRLLKPTQKKTKKSKAAQDGWHGVDQNLFSVLRDLRSTLSTQKKVPAYVIFSDAALRDMARRKPTNTEQFLEVKGVGETKCRQYGEAFIAVIQQHTSSRYED